ncbi:MAG: hypothetical protein OXN83_04860, partial [Oligoflexia bacterium]|nr:hypothetical protein [Oligoflexia bacterium]
MIVFISYIFAQKFYRTDAYYSIRNLFLDEKKSCWNEVNFKKIEKQLLTLKVKEKKPLFKNEKPHIFLIVFENGLKAVFKIKKKINFISSLRAYHLSQFLNLRVVPPTVIRTIEGKRGILQYFIEGQRLIDIDLETLTEIQKIKVYLFYFLVGYNDPHDENVIMGRNCGHLAVVDNSANMWFPTISQFRDFPFI